MRGLKKIISLLLALFIILGNIVPAFADEIVESKDKEIIEQSSQSNEENTIEQNSQINEENQKNNNSEIDSSNILNPPLRKTQVLSDDSSKPGFNETNVVVRLSLHGLNGGKFDLEDVYPDGLEVILEGECIDVHYKDLVDGKEVIKEFNGEINETRSVEKNDLVQDIDFGIQSQLFFSDYLEGDEDGDKYFEAYPDPDDSDRINSSFGIGGIEWVDGVPTTVLTLDLYQSQNTELIFNTINSKGEIVDNPNFGEFIYKIGSEIRTNNIPSDTNINKIDPFEGLIIDSENLDNFNGSKTQQVTLKDSSTNGFMFKDNDEFAYKIIRTKQEKLSRPMEVTLIKKQKLIKGGDRPKYIDPISGEEVDDPDYVKVEFKVNDHGSIESGESVYWVLKDLDLKDSIKAPKVKLEYGYGLKGWNPWFNSETQKYSQDTIHVAIIDKIKYFDYLTFSGDVTTNRFTFTDGSRLELIGLVDEYGIYKRDQIKSYIDFEKTPERVRVTMTNGLVENPGVKELKVPFQMKVDNSFGNDILKTQKKELVRETTFLAKDIFGNTSWWGIRYTIKNQNTKGTVTPKEKETFKDIALTKEEIYKAVEDGEFSYNSDVPKQNKSGDNALHREVDGKNLLNSKKVNGFSISDADYKKLDFSKLKDQEVPVTITYLDNSKSTVNVKIKIKENVPTGLTNDNKNSSKILLFVGFVGIVVSAFNFRKKFLKNYE
ncbi:hypothetical protein [Anaerococcus jeddahensis]|uniref:hypothetical protein n=1 Tax=Anaerococcus jeddahensis TaxID=1673719 RepID=UPI0006725A70|nr:hypothetical protein [Anaerococcus jeddahensis]